MTDNLCTNDATTANTKQIGFWQVFAFLTLGPIIAAVYAAYSLGYWLEGKGWGQGWKRLLGYPYMLAFAVLNTAHNWTVCTILFWEFPREFMTTARLKRHKLNDDPSRREMADLLGGFLDRQDPDHY